MPRGLGARTWAWRAARIALPAYWIALAVATHYPHVRIPGELPQSDKLVHFAAFGLLALLYVAARRARGPLAPGFAWRSAAVLIPYAAVDEYLQQAFGRTTDPVDLAANCAGIAAALIAVALVHRRARVAGPGSGAQ